MLKMWIAALAVCFTFSSVVYAQDKAQLGSKAPEFTLTDHAGKSHKLSDHSGKIVVLEWINPECPFVVRHYKTGTMKQLAEKYAGQEVVWLAINTTSHAKPEEMKAWADKHGFSYPVLMDNSGEVGKKYGAQTTPHMYIIHKDGTLVYQGGIDNDPSGDKADKTNYVSKALDELLAGKEVSQAQSKPYGCSVKYAN